MSATGAFAADVVEPVASMERFPGQASGGGVEYALQ